jgi:CRISPR-associated protein Cas1
MFARFSPRSFSPPPAVEAPLRLQALKQAWKRVKANGGGPGADGVKLPAFERGLDRRLRGLADDLVTGLYLPGGLRRAPIAKPYGGLRWLAIPDIRDRIVQCAVAQHLSHRIDPAMSASSFGYRPRRGVQTALAALRRARAAGLTWTLDADIKSFFDEAPHARVLECLAMWIPDEPRLISLIALWLSGFGRGGRGLAQGSPVSPILANLLLDPLDRALEGAGLPCVRYADDFVVPTATEAEARSALRLSQAVLAELGLRLNPDKTFIRRPGERFVFLGERESGHGAGPWAFWSARR